MANRLVVGHRHHSARRQDYRHAQGKCGRGTHQQPLAQHGIYYKLYQLQYKIRRLGRCRWAGHGRRGRLVSRGLVMAMWLRATRPRVSLPLQCLRAILISAGGLAKWWRAAGAALGGSRESPDHAKQELILGAARGGCDTVVDATATGCRRPGFQPSAQNLGLFIAVASRQRRPDLLRLDSLAFNWRVARQMHKRGILVLVPQFGARMCRCSCRQRRLAFPLSNSYRAAEWAP